MDNATKPIVDVDASTSHSSIVFFQDKATRFTLAADKQTGRLIGTAGLAKTTTRAAFDAVFGAFTAWRKVNACA